MYSISGGDQYEKTNRGSAKRLSMLISHPAEREFSVLSIEVKRSLLLNASCSLDIRIHTETLQFGVGAGNPATATASPAVRRRPPPNCASESQVPPVSWPS